LNLNIRFHTLALDSVYVEDNQGRIRFHRAPPPSMPKWPASRAAFTAASPGCWNAGARGRNYSWAQLMRRVFAVAVLECPECHGTMRILSAIHAPEAIQKILDCLGLPPRTPPIGPALPEREMDEPYLC
jgi:hypothetical protein